MWVSVLVCVCVHDTEWYSTATCIISHLDKAGIGMTINQLWVSGGLDWKLCLWELLHLSYTRNWAHTEDLETAVLRSICHETKLQFALGLLSIFLIVHTSFISDLQLFNHVKMSCVLGISYVITPNNLR